MEYTASELRLGNFLMDEKTGDYLTVVDVSYQNIGFMPHKGEALPEGWQAVPITLTKKWFKLFSFKAFRPAHYTLDWFMVTLNEREDYEFYFRNQILYLKYVHQLQNLYFTLTGKELKLKVFPE